jgi:hypothetical protein
LIKDAEAILLEGLSKDDFLSSQAAQLILKNSDLNQLTEAQRQDLINGLSSEGALATMWAASHGEGGNANVKEAAATVSSAISTGLTNVEKNTDAAKTEIITQLGVAEGDIIGGEANKGDSIREINDNLLGRNPENGLIEVTPDGGLHGKVDSLGTTINEKWNDISTIQSKINGLSATLSTIKSAIEKLDLDDSGGSGGTGDTGGPPPPANTKYYSTTKNNTVIIEDNDVNVNTTSTGNFRGAVGGGGGSKITQVSLADDPL